ncbi:MAG: nitroreductase family protein [Phycisphaerae bacterium]|nr:nitroreductase family protein [Phycisphaerae bacterium]
MTVMHSLYRESGKVEIDPNACSQCGACARICPTEVLAMDNGEICVHPDRSFGCIACGHCMMVCPNKAVTVTGRGISPEDLLPMPAPENTAGADELAALMQTRRSVRRFSDRPVDGEVLDRIVEMAATAPMGIPPWDVGCVTIRTRQEVKKVAKEVIKGYQGFLKIFKPWLLTIMRPFMGKAKYDMFAHFIRPLAQSYVQGHRQGRDLLFYDAPAVLIFHHSPYADPPDAMIACTYAMLAAESLHLGTTMIGGAPPIIQRNKSLCQTLGIPDANTPSIALIIGHPATKFQHTIQRRFTSVSNMSQ